MAINFFLTVLTVASVSQGWGASVRPHDLAEDIEKARGLLGETITDLQSFRQKVEDFYYVYVDNELPPAARTIDDTLVYIGISNVEMEVLRCKYNSETTRSKVIIDRVLFDMDRIVTRLENTITDLDTNQGALEKDVNYLEDRQSRLQENIGYGATDIRNMTSLVGNSALDLIHGVGGDEAFEVRTMVADIFERIKSQYGTAMISNLEFSKKLSLTTAAVRWVISHLPAHASI